MVSPLRTWQHSEPKGLWPALGGLAVVAHVGVIGLSLPYVGGLMGGGGSGAPSVVPVELIVTDVAESLPVEVKEADGNAGESNRSVRPAEATPPAPAKEASPPVAQSTNVVTKSDYEPTEELKKEEPQSSEEPETDNTLEDQDDTESEESTDQTETTKPEVQNINTSEEDISDNEILGEEMQVSDDESELPASDSDDESELPVLDGNNPLPAPGNSAPSNEVGRLTKLSFISHHHMLQNDIPTTFPEPNQTIPLSTDTQNTGCPEVNGPPLMQQEYRIAISSTGEITHARPWKGVPIAQPMSEVESVIACLIERSGWSFTPALFEDEAKPYTDLLLTFSLE